MSRWIVDALPAGVILLGLVIAAAVLSFLYFLIVCLTSLGQARAELKPFPSTRAGWLPAALNSASYTARGQELLARYYRSFFFGFASAMVMVICGSLYVDLKDTSAGTPLPRHPTLLAVSAVIHAASLVVFLAGLLWLLFAVVVLGRRRWRGESIGDAQQRLLRTSLKWSAGSFVVVVLSFTLLRSW